MAYNWTTGRWEPDTSTGFDWTKAFSSTPMSMNGSPSGTKKTGILKSSNKNNIYFNLDFSGYNQWHSDNIVMPFYDKLSTSPIDLLNYNFEENFKSALDSFNEAGGFDYLDGTNIDRLHGLHSDKTAAHLLKYYDDLVLKLEDNIIGGASRYYNFPANPNTGDYFATNNGNTMRVGRNGLVSDDFFGIQTASRRPTIHTSTNQATTLKWDNFFKNLGYVGAYEYLDHWIPTREKSRAKRLFDVATSSTVDDNKNGAPIVSNIYGTVLDPSKISLFDKNLFESSSPFNLTNPTFFDYKIGKVKLTGDDSKGGSQEAGTGDLLPWYKREGWVNLFNGFKNNLPNLIEGARYAGQIANNRKVYEDSLKGIRPNLIQSYNTYRQVVGDEASKQAYYRRGVEGVTRASLPFTSDADRLMAYLMEAQRQANELQALGDLIDNQRIRETSELSAQHVDANRQRATEVANQNIAQINAANQAKWNLSAQRRAADWTSTNNLLLGYENRLRQKIAKREAILDNIDTLNAQTLLENDPELQRLLKEYTDLLKDPANLTTIGNLTYPNYESEAVRNKLKEIKNRQKYLTILILLLKLKTGGKVTYKLKDDLLYKTARDAVKHFREMTRLTDNSYLKSRKKVPKLVPHPKKLQQGGVAPFGVFTPLGMGGEYSQTAETSSTGTRSSSSKSSADDKSKDLLNLAKDLFSKMEGLPIDVSSVYAPISNLLNRVKYSGEELSSHEIATIYLQSMSQLSALKHNLKIYEAAKTQAINNDALDEFVITSGGKIISQNVEDGTLKALSWDEITKSKGKYNPLTNNALLELRAHDPKLAFNSNILSYVSDTVGINKVTELIKKLAGNIGTDEIQQQGYSKKQADNIIKGLELLLDKNASALLKNAPNGDYEYTLTKKDLLNQMKAALGFILTTLPRNMLNTLKAYADMNGVKPIDIIVNGVSSLLDSIYKLEWNAVTGKAAKDANGNSKDNSEGLKLDAATAFITGKGYRSEIELNPESSYAVNVLGRYSEFLKNSGENMGAGITMKEATTSTLKGTLDWNKATLGGSRIIPTAYNQIILNNGEVVSVDLPVNPSNPDVPDFERLKELENLDKLLRLSGIEDNQQNWQKVNELCNKIGISPKYDNNGNLNLSSWRRFAAFLVTTPDTALVNKNVILDMVGIANSDERELYNKAMLQQSGNKNFELSEKFLFFGHEDQLYKGTVFVPIKGNILAAAISSGLNIYMDQATDLEMKQEGYDSSKIALYKKPEYHL